MAKKRPRRGGLLVREERFALRLLREDLLRQLETCAEDERPELEEHLANVDRERREDRASRPKRG